jgi:hypothetical protein
MDESTCHLLTALIRIPAGSRPHKREPKERRAAPRPALWKPETGYYLPAAAAAAAVGIMPAIFIPSIRVRTASRLAPVSVHASTYG